MVTPAGKSVESQLISGLLACAGGAGMRADVYTAREHKADKAGRVGDIRA